MWRKNHLCATPFPDNRFISRISCDQLVCKSTAAPAGFKAAPSSPVWESRGKRQRGRLTRASVTVNVGQRLGSQLFLHTPPDWGCKRQNHWRKCIDCLNLECSICGHILILWVFYHVQLQTSQTGLDLIWRWWENQEKLKIAENGESETEADRMRWRQIIIHVLYAPFHWNKA